MDTPTLGAALAIVRGAGFASAEQIDEAVTAAEAAKNQAGQYSTAAASQAAAAALDRQNAQNAATSALNAANNAHQQATAAAGSAAAAQEAVASAGYLDFSIDDRGHLIYQRTQQIGIDFDMVEGRLVASWQ